MQGLIGKKIGMTQVYDKSGNVIPVTAVEAGPCFVSQIKTKKTDGYNAVQIAFGKRKRSTKPLEGHLSGAKLSFVPKYFREFRSDESEKFSVGQEINVTIFKEGDSVRITGTSIGKGFAGTVKRHHFSRGPMSHGSKSHRIPGSSGAGSTPGRVLKGTRRAGRMGGERVTIKYVKVIRVDQGNNVLLLKGAVPGSDNGLLLISK
jgi:large subunit ribosomal protein L3